MSESLSFEGPASQPDESVEATEAFLDAHRAFEKVNTLREKAAELHEQASDIEDTPETAPLALGASGFAFMRASAGLQAVRRLALHSRADALEDKADRIVRTESEKT
jgi:hypothetical protein